MHKIKKKAFTLIELIIVIAIIAILAVTAFLVLTKWMGKSRDSRRVNDISAINSALQIYTSDASLLPLPDNYSGVYDTGYALARYQGSFTDNIASQLSNISKNIKDPQSGYYGYSLTFDRKQYQLRALTESTVSYQNNITNEVYAAVQTAKMQGNYAGFMVTATGSLHSLWNVPSLFIFSGTAITSGYLFTGGNNNFLQDNKTTDNIYPVAIVDVSNLYNASTADDSAVYTNIINAYSGTNNVTSQNGATAIVQSAAGGMTTTSISTNLPDTYTKLLLHFDNNFTDSSSNNYTITNNNSISFNNTINKFGGYSAAFNGSNNYLSIPNSTDWNFGSNDFTIDAWVYFNGWNTYQYFYSQYTVSPYLYIQFGYHNTNGMDYEDTAGCSFTQGSTAGWTTGQWYHVALVRSGNSMKMYRNGTMLASTTCSATLPVVSSPVYVGTANGSSHFINGYLDELRVSKGIARRTSNFTPPTSPY